MRRRTMPARAALPMLGAAPTPLTSSIAMPVNVLAPYLASPGAPERQKTFLDVTLATAN